ncbi:MAG TPA: amidohydrolase [Gaiellaceae bacterium]|jgi:cytosine/adenosine deaminase-related metal-dependent hydrolase
MGTTLLRGGLVDVGGGEFDRADVLVEDGRIAALGDGGVGDEVLDCSRFAVVPGIVNAHNHSNENFMRGRWDNLPLEPWMLFSYPVLFAPEYSPDEIYLRTLLGGIEMLRTGATSVVDFLYELQGFTEETLGAVVRAYRDLGLRALIALGMSDRSYQETVVLDLDLVPADLVGQLEREKPPAWGDWEAFARAAVDRFHRPDEGISIGLAPSGPQRCTDEMLAGCARLADELDLVVHIHVLETRMQALSGHRMYGKTLMAHLDEIGFLGPRANLDHCIWLTDDDVARLAASGAGVVHNPIANLKVGSGVSPVPVFLDAGINVALGADSTSANDDGDLYALVKIAGVHHKVWDIDYERWLGAREAWAMATEGGAQAMGDAGLGRLERGRRADLVLLDLESRIFTPLNNPLHQIVLGATTHAVHSTMVGGRWVLREGRITGVDEAAVLAEAREVGPQVMARYAEGERVGEALLPAVRRGWLEALKADVGVSRSVPLD